ncbi:MAG: hypothetical protein WBI63_03390 [Coriobacteriia bacterium]
MKKNVARLALTAGIAASLVFGAVGVASAATPTEAVQSTGYGLGGAVRSAGARLIDVLADLTGLDVTRIAADRAAGQSIAAIAETNGVSSDAIVDAAVALREKILADRVASGDMTADEAAAALDTMTTRLADRVDDTTVGAPAWSGSANGGSAAGAGSGAGAGTGAGMRAGGGAGAGLRDGSCVAQ